jgi:hypothetical protein
MARTPTIRSGAEKVARDLHQLRVLEERLRHELLDDEERQELRDRVLSLRRRHSRQAAVLTMTRPRFPPPMGNLSEARREKSASGTSRDCTDEDLSAIARSAALS